MFNTLAGALGAHSDLARAELIGVNEKTLRRAKAGQLGADFMLACVATFAARADELAAVGLVEPVTLDRLFTVTTAREPVSS